MKRKLMRVAAACAGAYAAMAGAPAWALEVQVLSSFPELVTGGDALVKVTGSTAVPTVAVGGTDVTSIFKADPKGGWVGLVTGLKDGDNLLTAKSGTDTASVTLNNHATNATLFAGPQQTPFICENDAYGLANAKDATCDAPRIVQYYYRSNAPLPAPAPAPAPAAGATAAAAAPAPIPGSAPAPSSVWKTFDPSGPRPTDIEMTTTSTGAKVPMIIWTERGIINRGAYVIAMLHDPAAGPLPTPVSGTPGWNNRLIYGNQGGVGVGYHQGSSIASADASRAWIGGENNNLHKSIIRSGYAFAANSLNVTGTTANDVLQAESTAKTKERFIELFGKPLFTISEGTSGGSMAQHLIANNYPGLFDGILPWRSYPDSMSFWQPLQDCDLLENYFKRSEVKWTDSQKALVSGKITFGYCVSNAHRNPNSLLPAQCDIAVRDGLKAQNVATLPRCTWADNLVNVFGTDPKTGYARYPWDNVGVQYGLKAFNEGSISFGQFVELNSMVGGFDIDGKYVASRTHGDPEAVRLAYYTGRMQESGAGLASIPMLDIRGYTDGACTVQVCPPGNPTSVDVHDGYHSLSTRARLVASNGNFDNQVRIVTTEVNHRGPASVVSIVSVEALGMFDKWLTGIANDTSRRTAVEKVRANKPAELVDACYTNVDAKITDMNRCAQIFPLPTGDARLVAGAPRADDVLKCSLKPVTAADYTRPLTADQLQRLAAIFPEGVCDWSKPGVGQVALGGTWGVYTGNAQVTFLRPARQQ